MFASALVLLALHAGSAQDPGRVPAPALARAAGSDSARPPAPAGYTIERSVRERWLHGRQRAEFTAFNTEPSVWVRIDSVLDGVSATPPSRADAVANAAGRRLFLAHTSQIARVLLVVDASGRVLRDSSWLAYLSPREDSARERAAAARRGQFPPYVSLPRVRLWDLVPMFHPPRLQAGASWRDPVLLTAADGWTRHELRGERTSVLEGDTVVDGRRLWLVRHSASVRYAEDALVPEHTLDTLATQERRARGTIRGRYLYDPDLRLALVADDTTSLAGTTTLRYPDGRVYRTPARYEAMRRTTLRDPTATSARVQERRRASEREFGGMIRYPRSKLEERLAAGDTAAVDSAVASWRGETDPTRKGRSFMNLLSWSGRLPALRHRLLDAALAEGDTALVVYHLTSGFSTEQLDSAALRLLVPFMADPGHALAFGLADDLFYENPRWRLLQHPPAVTEDTSAWPCTPKACRQLAALWPDAREPRLRALGLITRLLLDPARWGDTVRARAARHPASPEDGEVAVFLRPALALMRGAPETIPPMSRPSLPGPGANWRAWLDWLSSGRPLAPRQGLPALSSSTVAAIRLQKPMTGRDIAAELRQQLDQATTDSARLVFSGILTGLGELRPNPDAVERYLRSSSDEERALGRSQLVSLFEGKVSVTDSTMTAAVLDRLLAGVLGDAPLWPWLLSGKPDSLHGYRLAAGSVPAFVAEENLPPAVRERWRARLTPVSGAAWRARPYREAAVFLRPSRVERVGPFVRVKLDHELRRARSPEQAPSGDAGSSTYYLLETKDGLVVVFISAWVT